MNALAWDDEPNGYIATLAACLRELGIDLTVCPTEEEFSAALHRGGWEFVVTDLVRKTRSGEFIDGARIAQRAVELKLPVFVVTQHYTRVDPGTNEFGIPPQAIVKSKTTLPGWMAGEIRDELRRREVYFHHKKVFLIYGHDRLSDEATKHVEGYLVDRGVELQMVTPERLFGEIANGLMERMHDCAAFVAVCTPDDKVEADGKTVYQPRLNVLFEMGMAMGLNRGLQRLVILQRWGERVEEQAFLPSDLGGVVPIRFTGRGVEEKFDELRKKLVQLKVTLDDPPTKSRKKPRKG